MKSYELKPTHENLLDTFLSDTINRDVDIYRFVTILNNLEDSCSIALDGNWGSGKTFFVKQVKMVMDAFNDFVITDFSDEKEDIKQKWNDIKKSRKEEEEIEAQVSVYYDAWLNDNDDDPILSLVYEILKSVKTNYNFKEDAKITEIVASIAGVITGRDFNELKKSFQRGDWLAGIKAEKDFNVLVDEFLESLLAEHGNRLVIFIDELDRCKPKYAVQLLERIKHYFSNDRITFVFSTNIEELQHTIKWHYGNDFNSCKYLDRFFDLRISLPPANLAKYYESIGFDAIYVLDDITKIVIETYHFELREIAKYIKMIKIAAYKPIRGEYDFLFSEGKGTEFCLTCLVPIMTGLIISDITRYKNFINGKDSSPLIEIMGSGDEIYSMCYSLLNPGEIYESDVQYQDDKAVKLNDKLEEVYKALFIEKYEGNTCVVKIGKLSFSKHTPKLITSTVSLLSDFCDISM